MIKVNTLSRLGFKTFAVPPADENNGQYTLSPAQNLGDIKSLFQPPIYTIDGKYAACFKSNNDPIEIINNETETIDCIINITEVQHIEFSPLGNYLLTWSRPKKTTGDQQPEGNLHIWHIPSGVLLKSFYQKVYKTNLIQWTNDEKLLFYMVTNEVQIYTIISANEGEKESSVNSTMGDNVKKLYHKGLTSYKASNSTSSGIS